MRRAVTTIPMPSTTSVGTGQVTDWPVAGQNPDMGDLVNAFCLPSQSHRSAVLVRGVLLISQMNDAIESDAGINMSKGTTLMTVDNRKLVKAIGRINIAGGWVVGMVAAGVSSCRLIIHWRGNSEPDLIPQRR